MNLSMIPRVIQTEVNVICRSRRTITLTEVWIILDIMRKQNPTIVLLYIQNSDRCKKRFAVKRLVRLTFQTAAGHFCRFLIFAALRWLSHQHPIIFFCTAPSNKEQLFTEVEMNSGGYLPSCEAARYISTLFTDTEVNNCF